MTSSQNEYFGVSGILSSILVPSTLVALVAVVMRVLGTRLHPGSSSGSCHDIPSENIQTISCIDANFGVSLINGKIITTVCNNKVGGMADKRGSNDEGERPAYTRFKRHRPEELLDTERVEVSKDLRSRVIGKEGWVIKEIMSSSGAKITSGEKEDEWLTVSGNAQQREHAKRLISNKVKEIQERMFGGAPPGDLVEVPDKYKGLVIGKGGDNLKLTSTLTGAKVICKERKLYIVSGTDEERQRAKIHIKRTVNAARVKGVEKEFNKAYCYVDGWNLPVDCKLKLEPPVQRDRMFLPGQLPQYRLRPAEGYKLQGSCGPRDDPSYLLKLKEAALESLRQIKQEVETKEYLMLDMWCHFGRGIIRGPDEEEAVEGEWTVDEANEEFLPSTERNWRTAFNQGVNLSQEMFQEYTCNKTSEEYIARYDLTFLTPCAHELRCKVWVARQNVEKKLKDVEVPFGDVKNILEEIHFEDEATRSRCRGWLVLPSRKYLQADILFPGCEFDCRLTIRRRTESGFVIDYLPSEDIRRTLSRYISKLAVTEEDGSGLHLPELNKPEGFHLIHKRYSRRSLYEIIEGFPIILSEESTWQSDGTTEETRESTDLHLHCKEWDEILKSGEWKPETIVKKIPEFFQFVRNVQDFVLREMKRTCDE